VAIGDKANYVRRAARDRLDNLRGSGSR